MEANELTTRQRVIVAIHRWNARPENVGSILTSSIIADDAGCSPDTVLRARMELEDAGLMHPHTNSRKGMWSLTDEGIALAVRLSCG